MPLGPKRAPGRYEVPVSNGAPGKWSISACGVLKSIGVPMKAISYFSSSLARQGQYGRRPKVEMPEKTESACSGQLSIIDLRDGQSTCVPPSPGIGLLVLYHKLLWGPAIGFCSWSP